MSAGRSSRAVIWLARLSLGAFLLLVDATALATPTPASLERPVEQAKARLSAVRLRLRKLRASQAALEAEITQRKRRGGASPALDRLLKQSVAAQRVLESAHNAVERAEADFATRVTDAVKAIDAEIRRQVPALRSGPMADRRRAAQGINALRALRKQLRAESAALAKRRQRSRRWDQYRVRVDAGDGPTELSRKADFVEDTRDKVIKKRRALIALVKEARQERQIAQAAQDFRTDVTLFDEETRQGRVLRQGAGNAAVVRTPGDENSASPPQAAGPDDARSPVTPPTFEASPPTDGPPAGGPTPTTPDPNLSLPPAAAPPTPTPADAPTPSRAIDPDVLLNLRVEDLAAGALDVSTLQKYVEDLRALEAFLSEQAEALRQRAETIEANEARDLDK